MPSVPASFSTCRLLAASLLHIPSRAGALWPGCSEGKGKEQGRGGGVETGMLLYRGVPPAAAGAE